MYKGQWFRPDPHQGYEPLSLLAALSKCTPTDCNMEATDDSRQILLIGVAGCLTGLTFLIVGLRTFARCLAKGSFGWDDYLLWLGSLLVVCVNGSTIYGTRFGLGQHVDQLAEDNVIEYRRVGISWSISKQRQ